MCKRHSNADFDPFKHVLFVEVALVFHVAIHATNHIASDDAHLNKSNPSDETFELAA